MPLIPPQTLPAQRRLSSFPLCLSLACSFVKGWGKHGYYLPTPWELFPNRWEITLNSRELTPKSWEINVLGRAELTNRGGNR